MSHRLKRLGLVVEGKSEHDFFNHEHVRAWFEKQGYQISIRIAKNKSRLIGDAQKHLEIFCVKDFDLVVFLIDQDDDSCPPETAKHLQVVRDEDLVIVAVVAKELEGWFLADVEAVKKATGENFSGQNTDMLDRAKERLKTLFRRKGGKWTEPKMARTIARYFSFERSAENNRSMKRFIDRLRERSVTASQS